MKLFSELALVPEIFDVSHYDGAASHNPSMELLRHAFEHVRFVRRPEDKWLQRARECCGDSLAARKLLEFLIKKKRLLSYGCCESDNWIENADKSHRRQPLDGLLIDELTELVTGTLVPIARVGQLSEDSPSWWENASTSCNPRCTASEIVESFRLLLRHGREIHLIDQFMDPRKKGFKAVLNKLLSEVSHNANKPVIYVHVCEKGFRDYGEDWVDGAKGAFSNLDKDALRKNLRVTVCLRNSLEIEGGSHDRYLLSDIGGCNVAHGFQESSNETTTVSVLSESSRIDLLRRYSTNPNTAYGLIESFTIGRTK